VKCNASRNCKHHQVTVTMAGCPKYTLMEGWLVIWGLTALSTQFRSYRTFKVEPYCKY